MLPQHAATAVAAVDVGRLAGRTCDAIGRLTAYAAQDDSEVEVLRVGMEDTAYLLRDGRLVPADNVALCHAAAEALDRAGASLRPEASRLTDGIVAEITRAAA